MPTAPEGPASSGSKSPRDEEANKKAKQAKLKRSRDGCFTCRSRKKRCDLQRPTCGSCERLSLQCAFPELIEDPDTGELVTVKQPNKRRNPTGSNGDNDSDGSARKRRPTNTSDGSGGGGGADGFPGADSQTPEPSCSKDAKGKGKARANGERNGSGGNGHGYGGSSNYRRGGSDGSSSDGEGVHGGRRNGGSGGFDPLAPYQLQQAQRAQQLQHQQRNQQHPFPMQQPPQHQLVLQGHQQQHQLGNRGTHPATITFKDMVGYMLDPDSTSSWDPSRQQQQQQNSSLGHPASSEGPNSGVDTTLVPTAGAVHFPSPGDEFVLPTFSPSSWLQDFSGTLPGTSLDSPHPGAGNVSSAGSLGLPSPPPFPFDPTYPHLIPIEVPNQPVHLPHQAVTGGSQSPSPGFGLASPHSRSPIPSIPVSQSKTAGQNWDANNRGVDGGISGVAQSGGGYQLPSPFLRAGGLSNDPDDIDKDAVGFVAEQTEREASSDRSSSSGSGSSRTAENLARFREEVRVKGLANMARQQAAGRQVLTISPSLKRQLPDLPPLIATQAPLLIDYFIKKLAPLVSVLHPNPAALSHISTFDRNPPPGADPAGTDIVTVYLPMAYDSDLMLIGILAWSAMHLADVGEPWSDIADVMLREAGGRIEHALKQWQKDQAAGKSGKAEEILGGLVLLSEVEICRGSTSNWYTPLRLAHWVIRGFGGKRGLQSMGAHARWLAQNWIYHELMSSTASLEGPMLEPDEYAVLLAGSMNSFMGACMPVFQIIAEISRLSVDAARCITYADREERIESLRVLAAKESRIKARLDSVYPNLQNVEDPISPTSSYFFVAFRCFVLTARLFLRQVVSHCNAHSLVSQLLVTQLLSSIAFVVGTPAESSLLFPIFIAGVDATVERDRSEVAQLFKMIDQNCRIGNIATAFLLLEEVWARNEGGTRWVNWALISKEKGWNISFA